MNKRTAVIKNVLFGFGGQAIAIFVGIIVPRMIMTGYGSDMNGILSTLGQIFTYLSLLGAGVNQSSKNALYSPVKSNERDKISEVISVTQGYFNRITAYYGICVLLISAVEPFLLKTTIPRFDVFLIILLEGVASVISIRFIESYNALLAVDGRGYFISAVSLINKLAVYLIKIVFVLMGVNIILLQVGGVILALLRVAVYKNYINRHYSWLTIRKADRLEQLKDRNSFFITQIAWTVFSSTDMILLSMLLDTKLSSVYTVYNMIFANLALLLNEVYFNVSFLLGRTYSESRKEYEKYHDAFASVFLGAMTIMMCISVILCIPFVKLYTKGINDANYIYQSLPVLFAIVQLLSWSRYVPGNLTGLAGYARQTSYISVAEAVVNIVVSLILIHFLGIVGVLIGTVAALPIKVIWCNYIADKKVMNRSFLQTIKILSANYILFAAAVLADRILKPDITGAGSFIIWGILLTLGFTVLGIAVNFAANPEMIRYVKKIIRSRKSARTDH